MVSAWLILFAPAMACFAIVLGVQRSRLWTARLAIGSLGISFLCSLKILLYLLHRPETVFQLSVPWVNLPGFLLEFGILINPLAILMCLVVTGVGLMIFIYSVGYMAEEPGFCRYFAYLCLFATSMLGIVLANNFITLFIFWELVGASSYLLIGYWYDRPKAAEAGKKAFLVNRIADFGFLLGILMLWSVSGISGEIRTLNFQELAARLESFRSSGIVSTPLMGLIGGLLFCGVIGKSAQFPLHVWLPDAMEGPTPVSALIHAATMVAAGVYLLVRVFFVFSGVPQLLGGIAAIGGLTTLLAASLAVVENDLKRVLAYSTLSQLGLMVMALGLGGTTVGMFHLTTHAFFKALLFLGAGCVIHALGTNNIWEMGGLTKRMPITSLTFFVASMALCGIFPLSGFWSKDEILTLAFMQNRFLWVVGTITAGMTAFYMGRVLTVAFLGNPRSTASSHSHAPGGVSGAASDSRSHEAPAVMTGPLIPLMILSVIGAWGVPGFLRHVEGVHVEFNPMVAILSSLVSIGGLFLSYTLYQGKPHPVLWLRSAFGWFGFVLKRKYFVDDLYSWINQNVQQRLAIVLSVFERYVIIGLWANGIAKVTGFTGSVVRLAQTGKVQTYALTLLVGLSLLIYFTWR